MLIEQLKIHKMLNNNILYYNKLLLSTNFYNFVRKTPLTDAINLSELTNNNVLFKREDMNTIFSFKIRGASCKISSLSNQEKNKGLIASSAGNHAQGVAYVSNKLKINSLILMPIKTPEIKINAVKKYGGDYVNILLYGNNYDETYNKTLELQTLQNRVLIEPFNDDHVISANSAIAREIFIEQNSVNKVFVPCGGGGLLAGIAVGFKYLNPKIKVIGVECENSAGMTLSLKNKSLTQLKKVDNFADGTAVKIIGDKTFNLCNQYVDDMITITKKELCQAIKFGFDDTRVLLEPAGALSIAGIVKYTKKNNIQNEKIVGILSGANCDFKKLKYIINNMH